VKIDIIGWYRGANVGDESFRVVFPEIFKGHDIRFVTPGDVPLKPYPDITILGGGAVISPFYLQMLPPGSPRYAIGVDISYESEIDLLAKYDFNGVFVRNQTDVPALQEKLRCPVHYMPDLAFHIRPGNENVLGRYTKQKSKFVGVLVTDYVSPALDRSISDFADRHWNFITNLAAKLDWLTGEGWNIVLIPCATGGYGDDRRMNLNIAAFMRHPDKVIQIMDTLTPSEAITLISQMQLTVCMRYHAHIFSVIAGTPFISIEFTRKVDLFIRENGFNDLRCAKFYEKYFDATGFKIAVVKAMEIKQQLKLLSEGKYRELNESIISIRQLIFQETQKVSS
jgi:polysaccharide pyruvyl transferase WcaK-like protein